MLELCLVFCALVIVALIVVLFLLKNKNKKIKLEKEKIERSNNIKNEFLSSMSREVRTPLNAIVGFSEFIKQGNDIDACKDSADDIILASQNLLEIINKVLLISKIEENKMELIESEYKPLEVFEKIVDQLKPGIDDKNVKLKTNFSTDIPYMLYGDSNILKSIIINILTNAIKYTNKGEITFNVNCKNEKNTSSLVITVEDTGIGIKEEKIDKLFNKFEFSKKDKNKASEETGLGLIITKSLVELMGGKITVQSKYQEGSKFTVHIDQEIKMKVVPLITEITKLEESIKTKENDYSSKRVLIVDDNKVNLKVATYLLKPFNVEIVTAESGLDCLEKIKNGETFDLIFMDDLMPKMSGIETLKELKTIEDFNTPVIALTVNASSGNREMYIKEGFKDYLPKPIEKAELNRIIEKFLSTESENMEDTVLFSSDSKFEIIDKEILEEVEDTYEEMEKKVRKSSEEEVLDDIVDKLMDLAESDLEDSEKLNDEIEETSEESEEIDESIEEDDFEEQEETDETSEDDTSEEVEDTLYEEDNIEEQKETLEEENINYHNREYLIENGINIEESENLLNGMSTFDDALTDFMEDAEKKLKIIKLFKEKSNFKDSYSLIRSLKTDVKFLGFEDLHILLYNFEKKIKLEDEDFLNANIDGIITEFERLINVSKEYLGK